MQGGRVGTRSCLLPNRRSWSDSHDPVVTVQLEEGWTGSNQHRSEAYLSLRWTGSAPFIIVQRVPWFPSYIRPIWIGRFLLEVVLMSWESFNLRYLSLSNYNRTIHIVRCIILTMDAIVDSKSSEESDLKTDFTFPPPPERENPRKTHKHVLSRAI